jgi:hypothetical protein
MPKPVPPDIIARRKRIAQLWVQANAREAFFIETLYKLRHSGTPLDQRIYTSVMTFAGAEEKNSYKTRFRKLVRALIDMDPDPDKGNAHQIIKWVLGGRDLKVHWDHVRTSPFSAALPDNEFVHLPEDWPKLKTAVQTLHDEKRKMSRYRSRHVPHIDIQDYSTPRTLTAAMNKVAAEKIKSKNWMPDILDAEAAGYARMVARHDDWVLVNILTREGAIMLGEATNFCTAYKDENNAFDATYSRDLLWLWDKRKGERFQVHFGQDQVMDEQDVPVASLKKWMDRFPGLKDRLKPYYLDSLSFSEDFILGIKRSNGPALIMYPERYTKILFMTGVRGGFLTDTEHHVRLRKLMDRCLEKKFYLEIFELYQTRLGSFSLGVGYVESVLKRAFKDKSYDGCALAIQTWGEFDNSAGDYPGDFFKQIVQETYFSGRNEQVLDMMRSLIGSGYVIEQLSPIMIVNSIYKGLLLSKSAAIEFLQEAGRAAFDTSKWMSEENFVFFSEQDARTADYPQLAKIFYERVVAKRDQNPNPSP